MNDSFQLETRVLTRILDMPVHNSNPLSSVFPELATNLRQILESTTF